VTFRTIAGRALGVRTRHRPHRPGARERRFSVGVAAHPDGHPRSPNRASDRRFLAEKLARADFAVTQFFFDATDWTRLVAELGELGVTKPVLPGIMPVTTITGIDRMKTMGAAVRQRSSSAWSRLTNEAARVKFARRNPRRHCALSRVVRRQRSGTPLLHTQSLDGDERDLSRAVRIV